MSGIITRECIDEILARCDLSDIVGLYTPVKKAGGRLKALCPFHQEKTPSFMINPDRQVYHCFGCGKGGNAFRFVMEKENMDFREAALFLAERSGVTITYEKGRRPSDAPETSRVGKDRLFKLHDLLSTWYNRNLLKNPSSAVGGYVAERKIPGEIIEQFKIGAAPDSYDETLKFCKGEGFNEEEILAAGLLIKNENSGTVYDRFRNRLIFPVSDEQNRVVGFSARTVETNFEGGKYINSPETPIFKKNRLLYGLNLARKEVEDKKFAIICEGQFDVIAFYRAFYPMAVAPMGTAFSEEQARILGRYCEKIFLALDSDEAGIKAALRNIEILLPLNFQILVLRFPEKEDPDSMLEKHGIEGIHDVFSDAVDFFDFIFDHFSSKNDISSPFGRDAVVKQVLSYLAKIESQVIRSHFSSELARKLKIPESAVFGELNSIKDGDRRRELYRRDDKEKAENMEEQISSPALKGEEILLELSLLHGTVAKYLSDNLRSEMISKTGVGRALEKVISLTLNGEWEFSTEAVKEMLTEQADPPLSRILTEPQDIPEDKREKAVRECVLRIKETYLKTTIDDLIARMRNSEGEPVQDELKNTFVEKTREFRKLMEEIKQIKSMP